MASDAKRTRLTESPVSTNSTEPMTTDMAFKKTRHIMDYVYNNIKNYQFLDQDMATLKSYILETIPKMNEMHTEWKNKATIGIFGKSGEGKSSLISAILEEEDLLPSGSFGACTAVVTQVEASLVDANYTAEIELISKQDWEKELQDLFKVLSDESEDRDDDMMLIAKEKITALYGEDADKKTLEELKDLDKYDEMNCFMSEPNKSISKCNASEFADEIACYIQHSESSPGGWYWPLVKSVRIMIPNCDLLERIILVDLPGTGDCNKIRDDIWKSKLRDCSSVWVVSAIHRATTEKGPWEMLKHCIEDLGPGGQCKSINFICTMTDDINQKAYYRAARLPETTPMEECIRHRNDCTEKKIKEKFDGLNPGFKKLMERFSIDVCTASSKAFFAENPILQKTETEIPKLQEVLKNLNKSIKRQLDIDYVNEAKGVMSLIQSFRPNTDKELGKKKAIFHEDLKRNLSEALVKLDSEFAVLLNDLEQCLSKGVRESKEQSRATAMKEVIEREQDNRGYHKTLKAVCKNDGCYKSRNLVMTLDLNNCLARQMKINIFEEISLIFSNDKKTGKSVQEQLDEFSIIQSDNKYPRSSMFHHIQNFIRTQEIISKRVCNKEALKKKKEMLPCIETIIKEQMTPAYKKAAKVPGKGSFKKMQEILSETIQLNEDNMFNEAKMEVLKRFKTLKLYIKDYLESELNKSMELFLLPTSTIPLLDLSREIEELESFEQLFE